MNLRSCLLALIASISVGCASGGGSDPKHGFDSPYKDPGGGAPVCPSRSYLVGNHCESDDDDSENHLPWRDDAGKAEQDAGRRLDAGADASGARDAGDAGRDAGQDAGPASDGGDAAQGVDIDPASADPDAGTSARLQSLHARFAQHCERGTRSNVGCIHYTAATP